MSMPALDASVPRVFLCMPHHSGLVHIRAAESFFLWPSRGRDVQVVYRGDTLSSMLPRSFSQCLMGALDARDRGEATHIAMIHSDVEAPPWWLDALASELAAVGGDFISAAIALKNHERRGLLGKTSTAVGRWDDADAPCRSLTAGDLAALPATFSSRDLPSSDDLLLCNTGLWLADLRRPWWDRFPGFSMVSAIRRDAEGGRHLIDQPEDWALSRFLAAQGSDYYATTAVQVRHHGHDYWEL